MCFYFIRTLLLVRLFAAKISNFFKISTNIKFYSEFSKFYRNFCRNFEEIQNSVLEGDRKEKEVEGYSFVFATKSESNEIKMDFQIAKEMFEKEFIVHALKLNRGKINQTALKANIPKKTLLRKIEKYEISFFSRSKYSI